MPTLTDDDVEWDVFQAEHTHSEPQCNMMPKPVEHAAQYRLRCRRCGIQVVLSCEFHIGLARLYSQKYGLVVGCLACEQWAPSLDELFEIIPL